MKTRRKHKSFTKMFLIFVILLFSVVTLGRFVINNINLNLNGSKEIYFSSDKLKEVKSDDDIGITHKIPSWNGIESYPIQIKLYNFEDNNLLRTSYDIEYNVSYTITDGASCKLNKTKGTIVSKNGNDTFIATITLNENRNFKSGETIEIIIIVKTTNTFEKKLTAKFIFTIPDPTQSYYKISDFSNRDYLTLNISNMKNEEKTIQIYDIDTSKLRIDTTNKFVRDASKDEKNNIIKSLSFKINPMSNITIRFYKVNKSVNYTLNNNIMKVEIK